MFSQGATVVASGVVARGCTGADVQLQQVANHQLNPVANLMGTSGVQIHVPVAKSDDAAQCC